MKYLVLAVMFAVSIVYQLPVHAQGIGSGEYMRQQQDRLDRLQREQADRVLKNRELDIREREAQAALAKKALSGNTSTKDPKDNSQSIAYEVDQNQKRIEHLRSQSEAHEKLVKVQEIYYRAGEGSTAAMLSLYEQQKSFEHQIELLEATVEYQQSK